MGHRPQETKEGRTYVKNRLIRSAGTGFRALLTLNLAVAVVSALPNTNAYVVNSSVNTVTVVDTATATILGTINVGQAPSRVAVSSDGTRAYVTNTTSASISVVEAASLAVVNTIPTGAAPTAIAVTPNGQRLYVMTAGGVVQVIDVATGALATSVTVGGNTAGDIAITPNGARAYVSSGTLSVIDTATNTATATAIAANAVVISPNGLRLYATNGGGVVQVVDTATNSLVASIPAGNPTTLALTPEGSRLYVGMGGTWFFTTYTATFVPSSTVLVIDTASNSVITSFNLGPSTNTAGRMAVTANRGDLYALVPSINSVAVAGVNTNAVRLTIPMGAGLSDVAITQDPNAVLVPYVIDAVDDLTPISVSSTGGTAIVSVLANDTLGGARATLGNVVLSQVSSTSSGLSLNIATGAVMVAPGVAVGTQSLVYRICETASPTNCDQATATVPVRAPYVIDAVNDYASSNTGKIAIASVLANDTLNALPATTANVRLTQISSTHSGLTLTGSGAVNVASGTPAGLQTLIYQICETASPANCDQASAAVTVIPYLVDAVDDAGATTRGGGVAVANVLANDKFGTGGATLANVALTLVSSTSTGLVLNPSTGSVTVTSGTPLGAHSLVYRICEMGGVSNCDSATVTVTVSAYIIDAVDDTARGSSKVANTPLASVLANDTLGGARATVSTVQLSMVSLTPANNMIRLDLTDGSVDVLGKTTSGLYSMVYRICEIANATNCDQATVSIDLTGK